MNIVGGENNNSYVPAIMLSARRIPIPMKIQKIVQISLRYTFVCVRGDHVPHNSCINCTKNLTNKRGHY